MLLGEIVTRNARRYPEKMAVVFGDRRYTFKKFNQRVNSLVNGLWDMGVRKGDRVAVFADNCPQYLEAYWAMATGGAVVVPLNCRLATEEFGYLVNNSEANTMIVGETYLDMAASMRPELNTVKHFIAIGNKLEGMESYERLVSKYPSTEPETKLSEDDIVGILYTSGTTGLPKGVMLTHRNIVAIIENIVISFGAASDDILLNLFPHFTPATSITLMAYSYMGGTYVGIDKFDPETALEIIQKERVTTLWLAPAMIASLLEYGDIDKYDLSRLHTVIYIGSPIAAEVSKKAIKVFGNTLMQLYGLTEGLTLTCLSKEDHILEGTEAKAKRLTSCGREVINVEVRVVDEEGNDVAPGEVGEIIARGDIVMKGYWKLPQATAEVIKDGYLYTGDMATVDEENYIYTIDRKKDVITSGGQRINSREIEEVLYRHPSVSEAAVIGIPDKELGEAIKAVVVLGAEMKATEKEIIEFCQLNLPDYAVPKSIAFVDSLPRSPMGKVLKRVLREKYQ